MAKPTLVLFTRYKPEAGGLHSGAQQWRVAEIAPGADIPWGAVKAPSWATVTDGWQDGGDGPPPPPPPPPTPDPNAPQEEDKQQ